MTLLLPNDRRSLGLDETKASSTRLPTVVDVSPDCVGIGSLSLFHHDYLEWAKGTVELC